VAWRCTTRWQGVYSPRGHGIDRNTHGCYIEGVPPGEKWLGDRFRSTRPFGRAAELSDCISQTCVMDSAFWANPHTTSPPRFSYLMPTSNCMPSSVLLGSLMNLGHVRCPRSQLQGSAPQSVAARGPQECCHPRSSISLSRRSSPQQADSMTSPPNPAPPLCRSSPPQPSRLLRSSSPLLSSHLPSRIVAFLDDFREQLVEQHQLFFRLCFFQRPSSFSRRFFAFVGDFSAAGQQQLADLLRVDQTLPPCRR